MGRTRESLYAIWLGIGIIVIGTVGNPSAQAQDSDLTRAPWVVDGFDTSNWTGSDLIFTSQTPSGVDFLLEGYFDWKHNGNFRGRELFTGTLSDDGLLHIEGFELVNPDSLQLAIYDAELSISGSQLSNGTWLGVLGSPSGIWSAAITVPEPPSAILCGLGIFLLSYLRSKHKNLLFR